jgi:hypothetical protein
MVADRGQTEAGFDRLILRGLGDGTGGWVNSEIQTTVSSHN